MRSLRGCVSRTRGYPRNSGVAVQSQSAQGYDVYERRRAPATTVRRRTTHWRRLLRLAPRAVCRGSGVERKRGSGETDERWPKLRRGSTDAGAPVYARVCSLAGEFERFFRGGFGMWKIFSVRDAAREKVEVVVGCCDGYWWRSLTWFLRRMMWIVIFIFYSHCLNDSVYLWVICSLNNLLGYSNFILICSAYKQRCKTLRY